MDTLTKTLEALLNTKPLFKNNPQIKTTSLWNLAQLQNYKKLQDLFSWNTKPATCNRHQYTLKYMYHDGNFQSLTQTSPKKDLLLEI